MIQRERKKRVEEEMESMGKIFLAKCPLENSLSFLPCFIKNITNHFDHMYV
jgi:hypothetical protein